MQFGDRSYLLSVLQSYKDHTKLGIEHFAKKTTFPEMGGVSKLDLTPTEKEEIDGINKTAEDLLYFINRFQRHLIDEERKETRRRE
jgi:hypothetical protein